MNIQILHLDPHDDIVSVRDKLDWAKTGRVLIVLPESSPKLNRKLDLLLILRHSQKLGEQLAFVSSDPIVRYYAPRLGIPVFYNVRKAQSVKWRTPHRYSKRVLLSPDELRALAPQFDETDKPNPSRRLPVKPNAMATKLSPIARLTFFTLGVMAFLSIAFVLFPSAQINLVPKTIEQQATISLTADPEATSVKITGIVPAKPLRAVVEGRQSIPTSGSYNYPFQYSAGEVQFSNLTDQSINVPIGTVVTTVGENPIRFEVVQPGDVPPGQSITLLVRAALPGSQGNQPAGSILAIEGKLGTQLGVTNPSSTHDGANRLVLAPSQDDRQRLYDQLQSTLRNTALKEISSRLNPGDLLIENSLTLNHILEEEYFPAGDQPADFLELNQQLEYQGLVIPADTLRQVAENVLNTSLPVGYLPEPDNLSFENITIPSLGADGAVKWQLRAYRNLRAQLSSARAIQSILGYSPTAAVSRLGRDLPLETQPTIRLIPSWWPRMPLLPFRIAVTFNNQGYINK